MSDVLDLSNAVLIGKGTHKKCFIHPQDPTRCVKVAYNELGKRDLNREVKYLSGGYRRKHISTVLPRFYGTVQTSLGEGYVVDFLKNADGTPCLSLKTWLENPALDAQLDPLIQQAMLLLKRKIREEQVLSLAIYPENILFQKDNAGNYRPFLVNDLGNAARIPLAYWVEGVRLRSIDKRWQEFLNRAKAQSVPERHAFIEKW
ncbi:MAG: hypothetical protein II913_01600 [Elusimicrobiaceae bacterium]|nr:hypothetical protein [Elusimicrobiaceae bacterium]